MHRGIPAVLDEFSSAFIMAHVKKIPAIIYPFPSI
jgi:hypothetical protein